MRRSVRQTAHALRRTSSCPVSGFGLATSSSISRCRGFSRTIARISIYFVRSCDAGGHRLADFAVTGRLGLTLMMHMSAAQKRHFIKNVLLEPFEPEINDRRHKKRNHL